MPGEWRPRTPCRNRGRRYARSTRAAPLRALRSAPARHRALAFPCRTTAPSYFVLSPLYFQLPSSDFLLQTSDFVLQTFAIAAEASPHTLRRIPERGPRL